MTRTAIRGLWLSLSAVAATAAIGTAWYLYGQNATPPPAKEEPRPLERPALAIQKMSLCMGPQLSFDAPQRRGDDYARAMVDHQGQAWVFLAQSMSFQFSRSVSPTGSILLWQWRDMPVKLRQVSIVTDTAL
ncbi:MAG: hypothetical protein KA354_08700 [Phycisphaerae bacterium]|nr:hypothetical protein [Phycisphaerae bacterium]